MKAILTLVAMAAVSVQAAMVTNYLTDSVGKPVTTTVIFTPATGILSQSGTNILGPSISVRCVAGVWRQSVLGGFYYVDQGFGGPTLIYASPGDVQTNSFSFFANAATNPIPSFSVSGFQTGVFGSNIFGLVDSSLSSSNAPQRADPFYSVHPVPWLTYNAFLDLGNYGLNLPVTGEFFSNTVYYLSTNKVIPVEALCPDDGWQNPVRIDGHLIPNLTNWPTGFTNLIPWVHSLGFKFIIYTSVGTNLVGCEGYPATTYETLDQDFADFAAWGVDGIRTDTCGTTTDDNIAEVRYNRSIMQAFSRLGKTLYWNNGTVSWGIDGMNQWENTMANAWTPINTNIPFGSVGWPYPNQGPGLYTSNYMEKTVDYLLGTSYSNQFASLNRPGHFMQPITIYGQTVSYWPSIFFFGWEPMFGLAVTNILSDASFSSLTNKELIDLCKDPAVYPALLMWTNSPSDPRVHSFEGTAVGAGLQRLYARDLGGTNLGNKAFMVVNGDFTHNIVTNFVSWDQIGWTSNTLVEARDVMFHTNHVWTNGIQVPVLYNRVAIFTAKPIVGQTTYSNSTALWPTAPKQPGEYFIGNSNGYPYLLLSTNGGGGGSTTWTSTNKLGW